MSNHPLSLQAEYYAAAAAVLARAFEDDPAILVILKGFSVEERINVLTVAFEANLQRCGSQAAPLAINNEAELAGVAMIHRPNKFPPPLAAQLGVFWAGFKTVRSLSVMARWAWLLSTLGKHHPQEPHYYLELLGVEPTQQGLGFGSRLLQQLTGQADAEGVGCYLETTKPRNVPFYQRFGFQVTKELDVIGVHVWLMWRPPNK